MYASSLILYKVPMFLCAIIVVLLFIYLWNFGSEPVLFIGSLWVMCSLWIMKINVLESSSCTRRGANSKYCSNDRFQAENHPPSRPYKEIFLGQGRLTAKLARSHSNGLLGVVHSGAILSNFCILFGHCYYYGSNKYYYWISWSDLIIHAVFLCC